MLPLSFPTVISEPRGSHPWLGHLQGRPYTAKVAYKRNCPWPARKGPTPIEATPPAVTTPVGRPPTNIGSSRSGSACPQGRRLQA
ncbi:hypothetical protein B296_00052360 [Ensete ventricosum]|uniref:Uncharacterized protein n=1 Tax=Ensete ventricosum TaxID=4639 RepID=A0A426YCQ8_ENSVE|nr:hypothetical protein B296_00052360 [Ensete ventricosum]